MLLYPWGVRVGEGGGPLPPICVYGPASPRVAPAGDATFGRQTTIHPERPFPGVTDLVDNILAGYAYHLNVMPLDCSMPDPGSWCGQSTFPFRRQSKAPRDDPSVCSTTAPFE
jgi:hypothetical protein